jgi:hypothetical protein
MGKAALLRAGMPKHRDLGRHGAKAVHFQSRLLRKDQEGTDTVTKPKREQDDASQSKRFVEMAREIGASESEDDARRAFKSVVRPKKAGTAPVKKR